MAEDRQAGIPELLGRLDERTKAMADALARIEDHQKRQNDSVSKNTVRSEVNSSSIRRIYWLMGGVFVAACSIAGIVAAAVAA